MLNPIQILWEWSLLFQVFAYHLNVNVTLSCKCNTKTPITLRDLNWVQHRVSRISQVQGFKFCFFVFLWKNACGCFALLPRCSRNASSGKNSVSPWREQWNKILHTIHLLLDIAYEHAEAGLYDVFDCN